jgi:hypothetical protein
MDQLAHLFTSPYMPFTVALLVMLGIGIIEAFGLGLTALDFDLGLDGKDNALSWLGVGEVPILMILVVFLALFGASGLVIQNAVGPLSLLLAVPGALVVTFPLLGISSRFMARIIPRDETTAISVNNLLGKRATIIIGEAWRGHPTRAKLTDMHGQTHFVLVEPDAGTVGEGDVLILVRREGDRFVGTAPYSTELKSI